MFRLYKEGDGASGPLGIKAITSWLNGRGHRTRSGARWTIGLVHGLLTGTVYRGEYRFNRKGAKSGTEKPGDEQVAVGVEPIIDPAVFDGVQSMLKARNPRVTPPRVVSGPILLTGLATCADCSAAR